MRTIIVGDIHGCISEFSALLNKLELCDDDQLYSVGDIIDKGPDPLGCIRLAMKLKVQSVKGNHEDKCIRWLKHEMNRINTGKSNPMLSVSEEEKKLYSSLSDSEASWLCSLPLSINIEKFNTIIIHGGFLPRMPIERQLLKKEKEIIRLRYVDENGKFVGILNSCDRPEGSRLWSEAYDGPANIVYGHMSYENYDVRIDNKNNGVKCVGIDTACVLGGKLTAYILEEESFIQVQAEKQYALPWTS